MFKALRIILLLLVLASVAQTAWLARTRAASWDNTLHVGIYPIAADNSVATQSYVGTLGPADFRSIDAFFTEEAKRYHLEIYRAVSTAVAPPLAELPPQPPRNASAWEVIIWSLRMRWWAWRHDKIADPRPAVRLFVLFHDPEINPHLSHSTGLSKGMLGIINAFASPAMTGSNAVIVTHELLHTLGATDKYDPATNLPLFPDGYAEPERDPRYPQAFAEIMGGRIPRSPTAAETPRSLDQTLVGTVTAREIGWIKP